MFQAAWGKPIACLGPRIVFVPRAFEISQAQPSWIERAHQDTRRFAILCLEYGNRQFFGLKRPCVWWVGHKGVGHKLTGSTSTGTYGQELIPSLALELTQAYISGYSAANPKLFRQFYVDYNGIGHTTCDQSASTPREIGHTLGDPLSWSHYRRLMCIDNRDIRAPYQTKDWQAHIQCRFRDQILWLR